MLWMGLRNATVFPSSLYNLKTFSNKGTVTSSNNFPVFKLSYCSEWFSKIAECWYWGEAG